MTTTLLGVPMLAYIDPGTGSMLFTLVIGLISAGYFFFRKLIIRIKFLFAGGAGKQQGKRLPFVIFSDHKRYWNVFEPICDEFERRGIDMAFWTASPDDPALERSYEHVDCEFIGAGNRAFARLNTMSADVCIATTPGLGVYQWKRSKDVGWYVHVKHGVDTNAGYRMFGLDFYDAELISGAFLADEVREIEQLRGLPEKELVVAGCTYLDAMMERKEQMALPETSQKTVLLAPSWGESGILGVYGASIIEALLSTDFHVIVRPHPQTVTSETEMLDGLMKRFPASDRLEWNFDNDNFACLARSDVLVTDFSGVVYEFTLIFDRPVIYAEGQFDPAVYDAAWLDHPLRKFDHFAMMGRPLRQEMLSHMGEVLNAALEDEELAAGRAAVRDEVWQHRGTSAQETVDYLVMARERLTSQQDTTDKRDTLV